MSKEKDLPENYVVFASGQMEQMERMNEQLIKSNEATQRSNQILMIVVIVFITFLFVGGLLLFQSLHGNQYLSRLLFDLDVIARHFL